LQEVFTPCPQTKCTVLGPQLRKGPHHLRVGRAELNLSAQLSLCVIMKVYKTIKVSDLPSQMQAEANINPAVLLALILSSECGPLSIPEELLDIQ